MSNRATIEPTEFRNVRGGKPTFGVRVYDEYAQAYDNTWDSIPDDDLDVLDKVEAECTDEVIVGILDYLKENCTGIEIGDTWYEWDAIKHVLGHDEDQPAGDSSEVNHLPA